MSTPTAEEVRLELEAWLDENWDENLTVREWWQRIAPTGYAHPTYYECSFQRVVFPGYISSGFALPQISSK